MSAVKRAVLICDVCDNDIESDDDETSIRYLRASAKQLGWRTGLNPTLDVPSLELKSDLCPDCVKDRP